MSLYFVRKSGNDSNSGTSKVEAKQTISAAWSSVSGGDTLVIGSGVYEDEDAVLSAKDNITIQGDVSGELTEDSGPVVIKRLSGTASIFATLSDSVIHYRNLIMDQWSSGAHSFGMYVPNELSTMFGCVVHGYYGAYFANKVVQSTIIGAYTFGGYSQPIMPDEVVNSILAYWSGVNSAGVISTSNYQVLVPQATPEDFFQDPTNYDYSVRAEFEVDVQGLGSYDSSTPTHDPMGNLNDASDIWIGALGASLPPASQFDVLSSDATTKKGISPLLVDGTHDVYVKLPEFTTVGKGVIKKAILGIRGDGSLSNVTGDINVYPVIQDWDYASFNPLSPPSVNLSEVIEVSVENSFAPKFIDITSIANYLSDKPVQGGVMLDTIAHSLSLSNSMSLSMEYAYTFISQPSPVDPTSTVLEWLEFVFSSAVDSLKSTFKVQIADDDTFTTGLIDVVNSTDFQEVSAVISGLTPNSSYSIRVVVEFSVGSLTNQANAFFLNTALQIDGNVVEGTSIVYTDDVDGDDTTGDGSVGNPVKTITKAHELSAEGGIIYAVGKVGANYYKGAGFALTKSITIVGDGNLSAFHGIATDFIFNGETSPTLRLIRIDIQGGYIGNAYGGDLIEFYNCSLALRDGYMAFNAPADLIKVYNCTFYKHPGAATTGWYDDMEVFNSVFYSPDNVGVALDNGYGSVLVNTSLVNQNLITFGPLDPSYNYGALGTVVLDSGKNLTGVTWQGIGTEYEPGINTDVGVHGGKYQWGGVVTVGAAAGVTIIEDTNAVGSDSGVSFSELSVPDNIGTIGSGITSEEYLLNESQEWNDLVTSFTKVIYVDSVTGDDTSGNGTEGNPYATMTKGYTEVTTATAGDVVTPAGAWNVESSTGLLASIDTHQLSNRGVATNLNQSSHPLWGNVWKDFGSPTTVSALEFVAYNQNNFNSPIACLRLQGSVDGIVWENVSGWLGLRSAESNHYFTPATFRYWRIDFDFSTEYYPNTWLIVNYIGLTNRTNMVKEAVYLKGGVGQDYGDYKGALTKSFTVLGDGYSSFISHESGTMWGSSTHDVDFYRVRIGTPTSSDIMNYAIGLYRFFNCFIDDNYGMLQYAGREIIAPNRGSASQPNHGFDVVNNLATIAANWTLFGNHTTYGTAAGLVDEAGSLWYTSIVGQGSGFEYDFGTPTEVAGFKFKTYGPIPSYYMPRELLLEVSNDGVSYTEVGRYTNILGGTIPINFAGKITHRYFKFIILSNHGGVRLERLHLLKEHEEGWRVTGDPGSLFSSSSSLDNINKEQDAPTSNTNSIYLQGYSGLGDTFKEPFTSLTGNDSGWSYEGSGGGVLNSSLPFSNLSINDTSYMQVESITDPSAGYLQFDFGSPTYVDMVNFSPYDHTSYLSKLFRIEGSNDASEWARLTSWLVTPHAHIYSGCTFALDPGTFRYVRIVFEYSQYNNPTFLLINRLQFGIRDAGEDLRPALVYDFVKPSKIASVVRSPYMYNGAAMYWAHSFELAASNNGVDWDVILPSVAIPQDSTWTESIVSATTKAYRFWKYIYQSPVENTIGEEYLRLCVARQSPYYENCTIQTTANWARESCQNVNCIIYGSTSEGPGRYGFPVFTMCQFNNQFKTYYDYRAYSPNRENTGFTKVWAITEGIPSGLLYQDVGAGVDITDDSRADLGFSGGYYPNMTPKASAPDSISAIPYVPVVDPPTQGTVQWVSPTGNDGSGDGTQGAPYLTFLVAWTASASGDTIRLTGIHTYVSPGIFTQNKDLIVIGDGPQTVLGDGGDFFDFSSTGSLKIYRMRVVSNSEIRYAGPGYLEFYNCVIEVYFQIYPVGDYGFKAYNCFLDFRGKFGGVRGGCDLFNCILVGKLDTWHVYGANRLTNCLVNDTFTSFYDTAVSGVYPSSTTFSYTVNTDYSVTGVAWENLGVGTNPDNTQSHIGFYGGPYAMDFPLAGIDPNDFILSNATKINLHTGGLMLVDGPANEYAIFPAVDLIGVSTIKGIEVTESHIAIESFPDTSIAIKYGVGRVNSTFYKWNGTSWVTLGLDISASGMTRSELQSITPAQWIDFPYGGTDELFLKVNINSDAGISVISEVKVIMPSVSTGKLVYSYNYNLSGWSSFIGWSTTTTPVADSGAMFLLSKDEVVWEAWDGSGMVTVDLADIHTDGMNLQGLNSLDLLSYAGSDNSITLAAALYSNNVDESPVLQKITAAYNLVESEWASNAVTVPTPSIGYQFVWDELTSQYITQVFPGVAFDDDNADLGDPGWEGFYTTPDGVKLRVLTMGDTIGGVESTIFPVEVLNTFDTDSVIVSIRAIYDGLPALPVSNYALLQDHPTLRSEIRLSTEAGVDFDANMAYPLKFNLAPGQGKIIYFTLTAQTATAQTQTFQLKASYAKI